MKVWFITGAAKGLGNAIVNEVLAHGECVTAVTRKENDISVSAELMILLIMRAMVLLLILRKPAKRQSKSFMK